MIEEVVDEFLETATAKMLDKFKIMASMTSKLILVELHEVRTTRISRSKSW